MVEKIYLLFRKENFLSILKNILKVLNMKTDMRTQLSCAKPVIMMTLKSVEISLFPYFKN